MDPQKGKRRNIRVWKHRKPSAISLVATDQLLVIIVDNFDKVLVQLGASVKRSTATERALEGTIINVL